ncbi:unnamed protein product, partial [Ectocarpus sp. 13 AM-2016]
LSRDRRETKGGKRHFQGARPAHSGAGYRRRSCGDGEGGGRHGQDRCGGGTAPPGGGGGREHQDDDHRRVCGRCSAHIRRPPGHAEGNPDVGFFLRLCLRR